MTKAEPEFIKDLNALVAREARRYRLEALQETDWTIQRVMQEHGLTEEQARKLLDELTSQGHFEKIRIANPNGGGTRIAYRPVEKK